jgi:hypothetical protein
MTLETEFSGYRWHPLERRKQAELHRRESLKIDNLLGKGS